MSGERRVYLLDPQELPPETIAVAFAKTSRSPLTFGEIASELTEEKSAEFHEKWVVGYGHASVAEHAILHVAIENISRLAVESLESNRLASYTEKSTRYQKWSPESFYIPHEIRGHKLEGLYRKTIRSLFKAYEISLEAVRKVVSEEQPRMEGESDAAWDRRIRTDYVDVCRFLLPAASIANVGMTINARALEHALCKMLSHPLIEVRTLGQDIKKVSQAELPTLIKYAECLPYLEETAHELRSFPLKLPVLDNIGNDWCCLISSDPDVEDKVLAAALYTGSNYTYAQLLDYVHNASPKIRLNLMERIFNHMDSHSLPIREVEHAAYMFDMVIDQGAYFELKRHRMMTQTPQSLSSELGYAVPLRITKAGFESSYCRAMDEAGKAYQVLAQFNPDVASYVIPNGYNRRVLLSLNYRSLYHLVALRTASNAHFSMRRAALRMAEITKTSSPLLGNFLHISTSETWREIEESHFTVLNKQILGNTR